jgi:hypothetical protein
VGVVVEGYKENSIGITCNLHFMRTHTIVTTMGIPLVVAFEVEAIELNSEYERR